MIQHEEKQRLVGTRNLKAVISSAAHFCNLILLTLLALTLALNGFSDIVK